MCHSESKAKWEEAIVRMGEVGYRRERTRGGETRLRRRRSEFVRDSVIRVPVTSAIVHVVHASASVHFLKIILLPTNSDQL